MEIKFSEIVGMGLYGSTLYKHYFFNGDSINYLVKAQSYFTKEQKKIAKHQHRWNK